MEKDVNLWKNEYEGMAHKKEVKDAENFSANLASALDNVNEMAEKKRKIEMHTNITHNIFNALKNRQLDKFYEIGTALLYNKGLTNQEKKQFQELLETNGKEEDKLRLLILYIMYSSDTSDF